MVFGGWKVQALAPGAQGTVLVKRGDLSADRELSFVGQTVKARFNTLAK